jgi:brefeldin A-inhibited guanine nucleotide-exchange protein
VRSFLPRAALSARYSRTLTLPPSFANPAAARSFRRLLTEGGFLLPVEGQKISRIIEAFADVYIRENPDCGMGDADSIFVFAYSVLMLNTDLHNPRLPHNMNRRERHKRMTKVQFIARNRLSPELVAISDATMSTVYESIERKGIELPNFSPPSAEGGGGSAAAKDGAAAMAVAGQLQHDMKVAMRQAQAMLDEQAFFDRRYNSQWTADLVRLAFQEVWFSGKDAAQTVLDEHADDVDVVLQCLELLKYMLSTAIFLELKVPAQVFAQFLQRVFELCVARARAHEAILEEKAVVAIGGAVHRTSAFSAMTGAPSQERVGSEGDLAALEETKSAERRVGSETDLLGAAAAAAAEGVVAHEALDMFDTHDDGGTAQQMGSLAEQEWFQRVLQLETIADPASAVANVHKSVQRLGVRWRSQAQFSELAGLQQCFDDSNLTLLGSGRGAAATQAGERQLLLEGPLIRRCAGGTRRDRAYHFFLFNDMLVYAKQLRGGVLSRRKGAQFHAQQILSLDGMHVTPAPPGFDRPHAFCVHSAVKSFPVAAPTEAVRDKWVHALTEATRARRFAATERAARTERRERLAAELVASEVTGGQ